MNSIRKLIQRSRSLFFAATASTLLGVAGNTQAQGPVYSVNIVGFQKVPVSKEFPTSFYPPRSGAFFAEDAAQFAGGAAGGGPIVRKLAVQFSSSKPFEPTGTTPMEVTSQGRCSGEISLDGGATYTGWTAACAGSLRLAPSSDGSGGFDTEMLSLSIDLGGGVRLRESPTRASTGRTSGNRLSTARTQIDSFFDIFTELSLDNGNTWAPQISPPNHCPLSRVEADSFASSDFFPPAGTFATDSKVGFGELRARNIVHRDLAARNVLVSSPRLLPVAGATNVGSFATEISGQVSLDNGASFVPYKVPVSSEVSCTLSRVDGSVRTFDTEMLSLSYSVTVPDATGGPGTTVMLRESPTRASLGKHTVRQLPDGNFRIGSFFDIFTEVSLDGGATWDPCDSPARIRVIGPDMEPDQIAFPTSAFPPRGSLFENLPGDAPVLFADATGTKARIRRVKAEMSEGRNNFQLGSLAVEDSVMDGTVEFEVQFAGSTDWLLCGSTSHFRVATGDLDGDGAPDVAMTGLDATATANGISVMLRESPTRASKGSARTQNIGSSGQDGVSISSFFDVFTELSLDGGTTWVECDAPTSLVLRWKAPELNSNSDFIPIAGGVVRDQLKQHFETGDVPTQDQSGRVYVFGGLPAGSHAAVRRVQIGDPDFDLLRIAPPAVGSSTTMTFDTTIFFEYSLDGGTTWTSAEREATAVFAFACTAGGSYDTEMLALSLNGLPPGQPLRIRESPTRASTGRTSVRTVPGGHRVSSFFDIFTEVSIDDGATWCPAQRPIRCAATDCRSEHVVVSTSSFPTPGDLGEGAESKGQQTISGRKQKAWLCSNFRLQSGGGSTAPVTVTESGIATFDWSTDFGQTYTRVSAPLRLSRSAGLIVGEEECDQFSVSGGTLPAGVMLRESPSKASLGRTSIVDQPDGTFRIGSFFDIFTEVSVDGGLSWEPTDQPIRLRVLPTVNKIESTVATFPAYESLSPAAGGSGLHFADGSAISFFDVFTEITPEPLPDGLAVWLSKKGYDYYQAQSNLRVVNGGVTHTSSGPVHVQIEATRGLDEGTTQVFDTEMLVCDTGDATTGFMLRESPTKQSLGQTKITPAADGTFRISSFFDIFTEISYDGGATWIPSDGPLRLEGRRVPPPVVTAGPRPITNVLPGKQFSLFVACAPSLSPLHFQWLKGGVPIAGAPDSPSYSVAGAKLTDAGFYSCRVSNAGGAVVSAAGEVIVRNPFPPLAGKYNGLINRLNGLPPGTPVIRGGYFAINVMTTGGYSGAVFLDGRKYAVKGNFDADGIADITIPGGGPHVRLALTDSDADRCDATVDLGGAPVAAGVAPKNVLNAKLNPSLDAGSYTVLLPSPIDPSLPGGNGYALMKVTTAGAVTLAGRACDNQPFSYGGIVSADGIVPFYANLAYAAPGAMQCPLQFRDIPNASDCDGSVSWFKPAQPAATPTPPYASGFDISVLFIGSRYTAPAAGALMLALPPAPGNLVVRCEGVISAPFEKTLSVSPLHIVTVDNPGADKFAMKLAPKTGAVTGTFFDVATRTTIGYNGVVLQKSNELGAVYKATQGKTGKAKNSL